jgi:nitrogen fixation-related uncharacterized protein
LLNSDAEGSVMLPISIFLFAAGFVLASVWWACKNERRDPRTRSSKELQV